jgi:hypothetical protein
VVQKGANNLAQVVQSGVNLRIAIMQIGNHMAARVSQRR